jgi:3',5'-cyclic AMP phosphodiesterase CpdA
VVDSGLEGAIITGDIARLTGESGDYANLKQLSQPIVEKMPVAIALGNHDHWKHFLDTFSTTTGQQQALENKYILVMDHPEIKLIVLDSLLSTNLLSGFMGKAQREWLTTYLGANKDKPILLFIHHSLGDHDADLLDVDKLFKIIEPCRQVKAIFYRHSHVYKYSIHNDIHLINLPGLGYNFNDKDPIGWVEATLIK